PRESRRALSFGLSARRRKTPASDHDDPCRGARNRLLARRQCATTRHRFGLRRSMTEAPKLQHPDAFLSPIAIDDAVRRALDEDLGRAGDITSNATIPEGARATAVMVARQSGVVAGLPLAAAVFRLLSPDVHVEPHVRDGATVTEGAPLLTLTGPARAILAGERVALNFVGRLSGIATLTSDY